MKDPAGNPHLISDRSGVTDAVRVQILSTEHWGLLATRSMIWNEVFSRASMFITMLSASVVALALVAQATGFGPIFHLVALLVLPVVFLVGLATVMRLGEANSDDFRLVASMNRLRHAYLDLAPELEPYFTTGHHDDLAGIMRSYGMEHGLSLVRVLGGTPNVVAAINVVVFGIICSLVADALGVRSLNNIVYIGVLGAMFAAAGHALLGYLTIRHGRHAHIPRFPHD